MTLTSASCETATSELRWLDVGGTSHVLQQKWIVETASSDKKIAPSREEVWRNVPSVKAKK
jgi:hypothetical protein